MKLSDLQPQAQTGIDWNGLDSFFNVDAPNTLAHPLALTSIIKDTGILSAPGIDSSIVTNYLKGMAADVRELSLSFAEMKEKYNTGKLRYQNNYNEDAHMFVLTTSFDMTNWLEQYEDTVGKNFNDVIDYINSVVPDDIQITQ